MILVLNYHVLIETSLQSHFKHNRAPWISHRYFHQASEMPLKWVSVVTFVGLGSWTVSRRGRHVGLTLVTFPVGRTDCGWDFVCSNSQLCV